MSAMVLLIAGPSHLTPVLSQSSSNRRHLKYLSSCFNLGYRVFSGQTKLDFVPHLFKPSTFRIKSFQPEDAENYEGARYKDTPEEQDKVIDELLVNQENTTGGAGSSFLAKLAIVLGIAATVTIISVSVKQPNQGPSLGIQHLADGSSSSTFTAPDVGFTFKAFGYKFVIPEYAPGWIYFWLLMAAGFGLFISEEALNIWVCPL